MKRFAVALITILINLSVFAQVGDINQLLHDADSLKTVAPNTFDYVLALDAIILHLVIIRRRYHIEKSV